MHQPVRVAWYQYCTVETKVMQLLAFASSFPLLASYYSTTQYYYYYNQNHSYLTNQHILKTTDIVAPTQATVPGFICSRVFG